MEEMDLVRIYVRIQICYDETDCINEKLCCFTEVLIKLNGASVSDCR